MKILITILLVSTFLSVKAQPYLYYINQTINDTVLVHGPFLFQTPEGVYLQRQDSYYKIDSSRLISTSGIKILPSTSYYQDMYDFTRLGKTAFNLYSTGIGFMMLGGILALSDNENLSVACIVVGGTVDLAGFFVNARAWTVGKRANIKMSAVNYN